MLFSSRVGVRVRVRIMIRIRFSVWLVSCYALVFVRLYVVIVMHRSEPRYAVSDGAK